MTQSMLSVSLLNGKAPIKIDFLHTKKAALILRAINHKLRQQMLKLIDENKKMTVTEIYIKLLAILRRAGIVATQREGKFIYYAVNYNRLTEVIRFVEELVG